MTVEELRINNIVLARGAQSVVKSIDENHVGYSKSKKGKWIKRETLTEEKLPITLIQPIPLTEEWLVKFGFEKPAETWYLNGFGVWQTLCGNKDGTEFIGFFYELRDRGIVDKHIEHVHQLQNLYFALTGEELTIKN